MKLLLDTQILLWTAEGSNRLTRQAADLIDDPENPLLFSAASLWEIAIKRALGRADFKADPRLLRRGLIDNGYAELAISSDHALAVGALPDLHKDPFDRMLVAQATAEGITLVTADAMVAAYPGPIFRV